MSDHQTQSLGDHWAELRRRVVLALSAMIAGCALCYIYAPDIYGFLVKPLANAMTDQGGTQRLIYTGLSEAFFTYIRVALFSGIFITFPILLFQIWIFIAPGLYKNERMVFSGFLVATPILFFLGGACVYYVVLPNVWPFFLSFQSSAEQTILPVQLETRVSEYLDLIMALIFAFGLCFQLPVILALLARSGVINADFLRRGRKFAIIIAFIVAALLTPPDLISQIILAVPILILYEISILIVTHVSRQAP